MRVCVCVCVCAHAYACELNKNTRLMLVIMRWRVLRCNVCCVHFERVRGSCSNNSSYAACLPGPRRVEGTSLAVTQRPVIGEDLNVIFTESHCW